MKFQLAKDSVSFSYILLSIAFSGLIIATYFTVKISFTGHEAVIDKNYYEKGLNYEKEIEKRNKLIKEGYQIKTNLERTNFQIGNNLIIVELLKNDLNIKDANISAYLEKTATEKFNKKIYFENQNNKYQANLNIPNSGFWRIRIIADLKNQFFEKEFLVNIR